MCNSSLHSFFRPHQRPDAVTALQALVSNVVDILDDANLAKVILSDGRPRRGNLHHGNRPRNQRN